MDWISIIRALRAQRISVLAPTPTATGDITCQADGDAMEIRVIGEIHWLAGVDVLPVAKQLMRDKPKTVSLYVDSPGGDLFDAMALRAALDASGATVTAQAGGIVASAGVPVYLAGAERSAQSYTRVMVHQPRVMFLASGTLPDIEAALAEFRPTLEAALGLYRDAIASHVDASTVDGWLASNSDVWMTAAEAREAGIITAAADDDPPEMSARMQALYRDRFMALARHYQRGLSR